MKTPPLLTNRADDTCRTLSPTLQTEAEHTDNQLTDRPARRISPDPPEASKLYVCGVGEKSQPHLMDLKLLINPSAA